MGHIFTSSLILVGLLTTWNAQAIVEVSASWDDSLYGRMSLSRKIGKEESKDEKLQVKPEISVELASAGGKLSVLLERRVLSDDCESWTCPECNGSTSVNLLNSTHDGAHHNLVLPCPLCGGVGNLSNGHCQLHEVKVCTLLNTNF